MSTLQYSLAFMALAAVGAMLRFLVNEWLGKTTNAAVITLLINLLGSLGLGFLLVEGNGTTIFRLLALGAIGGFTTFGSFSWDLLRLGTKENWLGDLLYLVLSCGGGVLLVAFGYWLGLQI